MTAAIRLARADDGAAFAGIYGPVVETTATSFELTAPDADEMSRRIERIVARTPWLVCTLDDEAIGYAYAGPFRDRPAYRWTVEVSAYVRPDRHRSGVGRALYTSLFALLALQGFRTAYAGITLPNPASVRLHEAVGMTHVGVFHAAGFKFGRWHDVAFLERPLGDHVAAPEEPVLLPAIATATAAPAMASGLALLRLS